MTPVQISSQVSVGSCLLESSFWMALAVLVSLASLASPSVVHAADTSSLVMRLEEDVVTLVCRPPKLILI